MPYGFNRVRWFKLSPRRRSAIMAQAAEDEKKENPLACSHCERVFETKQAKGAAVRWCKRSEKPCAKAAK
jgi:hypothetical protein